MASTYQKTIHLNILNSFYRESNSAIIIGSHISSLHSLLIDKSQTVVVVLALFDSSSSSSDESSVSLFRRFVVVVAEQLKTNKH